MRNRSVSLLVNSKLFIVMKLLLENWREYLNETGDPISDLLRRLEELRKIRTEDIPKPRGQREIARIAADPAEIEKIAVMLMNVDRYLTGQENELNTYKREVGRVIMGDAVNLVLADGSKLRVSQGPQTGRSDRNTGAIVRPLPDAAPEVIQKWEDWNRRKTNETPT